MIKSKKNLCETIYKFSKIEYNNIVKKLTNRNFLHYS